MVKFNKKGQSVGLVTGLVFGVATLVIAVIIALVITSTLNDANLLDSGRETVTVLNEIKFINATGDTLDSGVSDARYVSGSATITNVYNYTNGTTVIPAGNYTLSAVGVLTNATTSTWDNVSVNYTFILKTEEEFTSDSLTGNLTDGIDNVSSKIPTVLLIAAIVLILSVLVLLIGAWQSMKVGNGGI